jgi:hypothetical protein
MDLIALVVGFAIGVFVVGIVIEMSTKKTTKVTPASKHAKQWDFSEISNPRIMAEYLIDAELPKDSKVVVNQCKDKNLLMGLDAKTHSGIRGNYVIGDDRVLILSGPMKKDEIGFWTVEKEIVERLNQEFEQMWADGTKMEFDEVK